MKYKHTKSIDLPKKDKFGIHLDVYPSINDCGFVVVDTQMGHNQEFYDKESTFTYIVLEGHGTFFLNDEPVKVKKGDMLAIQPLTRIYYKGALKMLLITNPSWKPENEVETKPSVW